MNWTSQQYAEYQAKCNSAGAQVQGALAQSTAGNEPLAKAQAQAGDTARYVVRVTSYRNRLLDEDNLCEKWHVDACRYAGLLPTDAPSQTHIEVRQVKVGKKNEMTVVEIETL